MRAPRRPALAALLVVAAGCGGQAAAATPAATPKATPVPVAAVDWANARYQVTCPGLGAPAGSSTSVVLTDGAGRTSPVDWFGLPATAIEVSLTGTARGDLTGDGRDEQLVHLSCHPVDSNGEADELQVFGPAAGAPRLLDRLVLRNPYDSAFAPAVRDVTVAQGSGGNGAVTGSADYWRDGDPHCCSSVRAPFSFTYDPATGHFVQR